MVDFLKRAYGCLLAVVAAAVVFVSSSVAQAQVTFTAADPDDILNAHRVDQQGGALEQGFGVLGDTTSYIWVAMIAFLVGWMAWRRFRRAGG